MDYHEVYTAQFSPPTVSQKTISFLYLPNQSFREKQNEIRNDLSQIQPGLLDLQRNYKTKGCICFSNYCLLSIRPFSTMVNRTEQNQTTRPGEPIVVRVTQVKKKCSLETGKEEGDGAWLETEGTSTRCSEASLKKEHVITSSRQDTTRQRIASESPPITCRTWS